MYNANLSLIDCRLSHERQITPESNARRLSLLFQFRKLKPDVFNRLRHFQPQSGCFNKCSFCSQSSSTEIIEFGKDQLADIIAAIKAVCIENAVNEGLLPTNTITEDGMLSDNFIIPKKGLIANCRSERTGVIYCYLDNDPGLYPFIDYFVFLLGENLGVKTRIATVGFSRHNTMINKAFNRLSKTNLEKWLAGIRLSVSPYTFGWTDIGSNKGLTSKIEYEADLANFLGIFKKQFQSSFQGRKGVCAELRFKPLIYRKEVETIIIDDHFTLKAGSFLYVGKEKGKKPLMACLKSSKDHSLKLDNQGIKVVKIESFSENKWQNDVKLFIHNPKTLPESTLHMFKNDDGIYYGIDVERTITSHSYAKYFYPKVGSRPNSGIIDGERFLLNAMLDISVHKVPETWAAAEQVFEKLEKYAESMITNNIEAANYILNDLIPLVRTYQRALKMAGFHPSNFFDKNITVDTGHICNLGRAYHEFKDLASRPDLPMTPNQERAFGECGSLAEEGTVYRIAPGSTRRSSVSGKKDTQKSTSVFLIEELDLTSTCKTKGQSKNINYYKLHGIKTYKLKECKTPIIIGQQNKEKL